MEKIITCAICLDHNQKCVYIAKVVNVSESEYATKFLEMQEHNAEIDRKFDDLELRHNKQTQELLDKIASLEQEIKVLKGEDQYAKV